MSPSKNSKKNFFCYRQLEIIQLKWDSIFFFGCLSLCRENLKYFHAYLIGRKKPRIFVRYFWFIYHNIFIFWLWVYFSLFDIQKVVLHCPILLLEIFRKLFTAIIFLSNIFLVNILTPISKLSAFTSNVLSLKSGDQILTLYKSIVVGV